MHRALQSAFPVREVVANQSRMHRRLCSMLLHIAKFLHPQEGA